MKWFFIVYFSFCSVHVFAQPDDYFLDKIIEVYKVESFNCESNRQPFDKELVSLGEHIFSSKALSGEGKTACATCHIEALNFADGLPIAVGVNGEGEGESRLYHSRGVLVPRNAFTLRARADSRYNTYFWDGKVSFEDGVIYSPFGLEIDKKFMSPLSVASVLPLLARDEFLGVLKVSGSNRHIETVNDEYHQKRYEVASLSLRSMLLNPETKEQRQLASLISSAGFDIREVDVSFFGNAIASFISEKINCDTKLSSWDRFVAGDRAALSENQKKGMLLFFGKGRCSACHSGPLFSDLKYHSLAVPQGGFGVSPFSQDLGRAEVTNLTGDRYKFRTPPLLGVSSTAPYGHNGKFKTLEEVIKFHINPVDYFLKNGFSTDRESFTYGKILNSRSNVLSYIDVDSEEELEALIEFLRAL